MSRFSFSSLIFLLMVSNPALADGEGECSDGLCGTPDESGGGGEGGGGSVLIANTDLGDTSEYADDYDEDGFEDDFDNCPWHVNPDQLDRDSDGWGDACDTCFSTWNPNQFDRDSDGLGDWCDDDVDGDGIVNQDDNCGAIGNPGQVDTDDDGDGDVCDSDDDGDGVSDIYDECPLLHRRHYYKNMNCVNDIDRDNIHDHIDNCVNAPNPFQRDTDQDGLGDVCDVDADGNGIADQSEWRPLDADPHESVVENDNVGGCAISGVTMRNSIIWFTRR